MSIRKNLVVLKTLCEYGWNLRRKGWYKKPPFIPIPPRDYLLWRFETAWGIDSRTFKLSDLPPWRIILRDVWSFGHWLHLITPHSKKRI